MRLFHGSCLRNYLKWILDLNSAAYLNVVLFSETLVLVYLSLSATQH